MKDLCYMNRKNNLINKKKILVFMVSLIILLLFKCNGNVNGVYVDAYNRLCDNTSYGNGWLCIEHGATVANGEYTKLRNIYIL